MNAVTQNIDSSSLIAPLNDNQYFFVILSATKDLGFV